MKEYNTLKILIKYKRKTNKELLVYCDAYLAAKKITKEQYDELVALLQ